MNYNKLGKSEIKVSELGFGAWSIALDWWGKKIEEDEAKDELIRVLYSQVIDLTMMSKIELGDDVIAEIKRLKDIIENQSDSRRWLERL